MVDTSALFPHTTLRAATSEALSSIQSHSIRPIISGLDFEPILTLWLRRHVGTKREGCPTVRRSASLPCAGMTSLRYKEDRGLTSARYKEDRGLTSARYKADCGSTDEAAGTREIVMSGVWKGKGGLNGSEQDGGRLRWDSAGREWSGIGRKWSDICRR